MSGLPASIPRAIDLLIVDYYGRLGRRHGLLGGRTALHDYVQLISG